MAKKKKGNYGKVLGFCAVVACAAALLGWLGGVGGGFGLPFGGGGNGGGNGDGNGANGGGYSVQDEVTPGDNQDATADTQDEEGDISTPPVEEPPVLLIRVVNDRIYHGDVEITIDELVGILEALNQPDYVWELRDEQAIMETYENVRVLMLETGIMITER